MPLKIRNMTSSDIPAVLNLIDRTVRKSYQQVYSPEAIAHFIEHHSPESIERDIREGLAVVAVTDGSVVGTGVLKGTTVKRVFVAADLQRQGIGGKIMDHLEREAARLGLSFIDLHASLPAKSFYDRRDYLELDFRRSPLENNSHLDYYRMAKCLKIGARNPVANLDGKRFEVYVNEGTGSKVHDGTFLTFRQKSNLVTATYEGNGIQKGDLVGFLEGSTFTFHYEHINADGERDSGTAFGNVEVLPDGMIRIVNIHPWETGNGQSSCMMIEV